MSKHRPLAHLAHLTLAVMKHCGVPITIENYFKELGLDPDAEVDAELFEMIPDELRRQYYRKHNIPFDPEASRIQDPIPPDWHD